MVKGTDETILAPVVGSLDAPPGDDSLDGLLAAVAKAPPAVPPLAEGTRIGRYLTVKRLGSGGMGVVYEAHDPQLDRRVAIKLLRPDVLADSPSGHVRDRILTEARALARLVHPNVVAVHDAGYHETSLYIVMELVAGLSLRAWLDERPRTVLDIVGVFRQAAAGLAAAHGKALVHRDFKPDNVLVGADGRVRVADFGLVRIGAGDSDELTASMALPSNPTLTQTGAFMGTLGYMAPEQLDGSRVDHRSDQFAFGVSLWQALHGALPYVESTFAARRGALAKGPPPEPAGRRVPAWLRAIVRRTLAPSPDHRFADMAAISVAIERGLRRRARLVVGALVVGVAGLVAASLAFGVRSRSVAEPCGGGGDEIAQVWNPERAAAFARSLSPKLADAAPRLHETIDGYARRWALGHRDACRATRVTRTQSDDLLDRRMACLARARVDLDATVRAIETGAVASEAVQRTLDGLPAIDRCDDITRLSALVPEPTGADEQARLVLAIEAVAAVRSRRDTPLVGAIEDARAALALARAASWPPLAAEATHTLAEILSASDLPEQALPLYQEAFTLALSGRDDLTAAAVASDHAVVAAVLGKAGEASDWLAISRSLTGRAGSPSFGERRLAEAEAEIDRHAGRFEHGLATAERVVALTREQSSEHTIAYGKALQNLATMQLELGRSSEAIASFGRALTTYEEAVGPLHPQLADALSGRSAAFTISNDFERAIADAERAVAISETWFGAADRRVADALLNLSSANANGGRPGPARAVIERALAILAALGDDTSDDFARHLSNLAVLRVSEGDLVGAERDGMRALAIIEKNLGTTSAGIGNSLVLVGYLARARGDFATSRAYLERAVANAEAAYATDHPALDNLRVELGHTEAAAGRRARALALFERVVATGGGADREARIVAEAELALAQLLGSGERTRARALATAAHGRFAGLGQGFEAQRDDAAAWLEAHP